MVRLRSILLVAGLVVITACGGGSEPDAAGELELPAGFSAVPYTDGLVGPTQMTFASNGDLVIAELNGGENDRTGRVLRLDAEDPGNRTILQTGLDKPTGIAVFGDVLWIMERQRLSVTTLEPDAARTVVADDLPFNGRSQGTLTALDDGSLLYDTSGSKRGATRVEGSATLFRIDDAASTPKDATAVATGFKHAYAHLVDEQGQLWSVEMTDGTFDDERASDELLAVSPGDDAGWPQCVDDNRPVLEFGGTEASCAAAPRSHALLGPGATPTSFVVAPWDPDVFVVALWLPGRVVTVPRTPPADRPHQPQPFIDGIESPQHLLADDDRLLVSDHASGTIVAVARDR